MRGVRVRRWARQEEKRRKKKVATYVVAVDAIVILLTAVVVRDQLADAVLVGVYDAIRLDSLPGGVGHHSPVDRDASLGDLELPVKGGNSIPACAACKNAEKSPRLLQQVLACQLAVFPVGGSQG